jgi:hypothetical protein
MPITRTVVSLKGWIWWSTSLNGYNQKHLLASWNVFCNTPYLHTKNQTEDLFPYPVSVIFLPLVSLELRYRNNVQDCFCNQIFFLPTALLFRHCCQNFEWSIIAIPYAASFPGFCAFPHIETEVTFCIQVFSFVWFSVESTLISYN